MDKVVGILYPVSFRVTDHLPSAVVLPSLTLATPRAVWQQVADREVSWVIGTEEGTWRRCLGDAPHYLGVPVYLGHLYYGSVYGWYAESDDDLAMLTYAMEGKWWPEECVECGEAMWAYEGPWDIPKCRSHLAESQVSAASGPLSPATRP